MNNFLITAQGYALSAAISILPLANKVANGEGKYIVMTASSLATSAIGLLAIAPESLIAQVAVVAASSAISCATVEKIYRIAAQRKHEMIEEMQKPLSPEQMKAIEDINKSYIDKYFEKMRTEELQN